MQNIFQTLKEIIDILSSNENIDFNESLVEVNDSQILTPIGDVTSVLFKQKSKLENQIIDLDLLKKFLKVLDDNHTIIRLNHIGFGYRVESQQVEKQRLIDLVRKTDKYLYEEESNDFGLWLFLGNTENWEKPIVEFVPVEVDRPQIDYFLPHIQIDVDTTLNANEIENQLKKVTDEKIKSYRIAIINGITYIVRCRLGVIDGVNIFLDLATNARDVKFHRQNIMKKIV